MDGEAVTGLTAKKSAFRSHIGLSPGHEPVNGLRAFPPGGQEVRDGFAADVAASGLSPAISWGRAVEVQPVSRCKSLLAQAVKRRLAVSSSKPGRE